MNTIQMKQSKAKLLDVKRLKDSKQDSTTYKLTFTNGVLRATKGRSTESTEFKKNQYITFTKQLAVYRTNIITYIDLLAKAKCYFRNFNLSRKTDIVIQKWINSIPDADWIWENMTSKPDYNLALFKRRFFPYRYVSSKTWCNQVRDTLSSNEYPSELLDDVLSIDKVFSDEINESKKNNNFASYDSVDPVDYEDMSRICLAIKSLISLDMSLEAVKVFCYNCIVPDHAHIIKHPKVWGLINPIIKADKDLELLVAYYFYYAIYVIRHEETIMFSQVRSKHRAVYTLEQACRLPTFNGISLHRNPYVQQLSDDVSISRTLPFWTSLERKILSPRKFERRFFLATGGVLEGFDLESRGCAVSGSILIPCSMKWSMEKRFGSVRWNVGRGSDKKEHFFQGRLDLDKWDIQFLNYLEYFYPGYQSMKTRDYRKMLDQCKRLEQEKQRESDILYEDEDCADVSSNVITEVISQTLSLPVSDLVDSKIDILDVSTDSESNDNSDPEDDVKTSTKHLMSNNTPDSKQNGREVKSETDSKQNGREVKSETDSKQNGREVKSETDSKQNGREVKSDELNPETKDKVILKEYNLLSDIDISVSTRDHSTYLNVVQEIFDHVKSKASGDVYLDRIEKKASVGYSIIGPGLIRPIDIFKVPFSPLKVVKKFYLPCVRMFYDGQSMSLEALRDTTVRVKGHMMFQDCVTTLLSGVNNSYKWLSCNKIPADSILKYAQRGLTTPQNKKERDMLTQYIGVSERWSYLVTSGTDMFGEVSPKHKFFYPGGFNAGIRMGLRQFEEEEVKFINSRLVTRDPQKIESCESLLIAKTNSVIFKPDIDAINKYIIKKIE